MDIITEKKKIVGNYIDLIFLGFNNNNKYRAKIDTGASVSSLHADHISVDKKTNTVKFIHHDKKYSMSLRDNQAVKSADGGVEYRPVITFNVKMDGEVIKDVQFNLNDRSNMEFEVLIGQNLLDQANILIDPTMYKENIELTLQTTDDAVDIKDADVPKADIEDNEDSMMEAINRLETEIANMKKTLGLIYRELKNEDSTDE